MNKRTRWLAGLLLFVFLLSPVAPVLADDPGGDAPAIQIPVRVETIGQVPVGMQYTIVLEADNAAYPMPEGSTDGRFEYVVGTGSHLLPEIVFDELGVFTYKLYQKPATGKCQLDNRVYELVVYVNPVQGGGKEVTVLLYLRGQEEKHDEAVFKNRCPKEPPVTEPPGTEPPGTEPPVTEPPATEPPVTEPPATEPPATEPPATEPPATEKPGTEKPGTEKPGTEKPVTEKPRQEGDSPRTGDAGVLGSLGLAALAGGGLALTLKRRKDK